MHCKSFSIRLAPAAALLDTDALTTFMSTIDVSTVHSALVPADSPFWSVLVFYRERQPAAGAPEREGAAPAADPAPEPLAPHQQALLDQLKIWRRERARQDGVPVYVVAHNATLQQLACEAERVQTLDDLVPIQRMGMGRAQKYGEELLALLRVAAEE